MFSVCLIFSQKPRETLSLIWAVCLKLCWRGTISPFLLHFESQIGVSTGRISPGSIQWKVFWKIEFWAFSHCAQKNVERGGNSAKLIPEKLGIEQRRQWTPCLHRAYSLCMGHEGNTQRCDPEWQGQSVRAQRPERWQGATVMWSVRCDGLDCLGREVAGAEGPLAEKRLVYFKNNRRSTWMEFGGAWHHFTVERMAEVGLC